MTDNEKNPGDLVADAVERCLQLATTWLAWDGRPRVSEGGDRIYTPHKVIRRVGDHLVDHLAEVEALLAGVPTQPDEWAASPTTFETDWARFAEGDLREAAQRLRRLGRTFALRYAALDPEAWDVDRSPNWTLRQIAEHLAASLVWYAEQVGDLRAPVEPDRVGRSCA